MICEHGVTDWCACIPRPPAHIGERIEKRGPGERVPEWSCQCDLPRYKRHKQESDCIPQAEVDAFKARHRLKSDGHARALIFIETFRRKA